MGTEYFNNQEARKNGGVVRGLATAGLFCAAGFGAWIQHEFFEDLSTDEISAARAEGFQHGFNTAVAAFENGAINETFDSTDGDDFFNDKDADFFSDKDGNFFGDKDGNFNNGAVVAETAFEDDPAFNGDEAFPETFDADPEFRDETEFPNDSFEQQETFPEEFEEQETFNGAAFDQVDGQANGTPTILKMKRTQPWIGTGLTTGAVWLSITEHTNTTGTMTCTVDDTTIDNMALSTTGDLTGYNTDTCINTAGTMTCAVDDTTIDKMALSTTSDTTRLVTTCSAAATTPEWSAVGTKPTLTETLGRSTCLAG